MSQSGGPAAKVGLRVGLYSLRLVFVVVGYALCDTVAHVLPQMTCGCAGEHASGGEAQRGSGEAERQACWEDGSLGSTSWSALN